MIGVDPHKGSHTAVAIGAAAEPLGRLRVRASAAQAGRLVAWAAAWPERTWAVEGTGGLGHLLSPQVIERVLPNGLRSGPRASPGLGIPRAHRPRRPGPLLVIRADSSRADLPRTLRGA
jgi:hypothetical protein